MRKVRRRASSTSTARSRGAADTATEATGSVQDYLAAVYDLASTGAPVIGARLAKHMGISAPAVTEAVHRMVRSGYLHIGPGKAIALTPKGVQIAEVMARRHCLLERWLTRKPRTVTRSIAVASSMSDRTIRKTLFVPSLMAGTEARVMPRGDLNLLQQVEGGKDPALGAGAAAPRLSPSANEPA
jgi:Mn-dependent DtxR family transcriptional regulator